MAAEPLQEVSSDTGRTPASRTEAPHVRAAAITTRLNSAHSDLVDLVVELLATDGWAEPGMRSVEHWLVVRAGLTPTAAREIAVVARRVQELPAMAERLHDGRLTIGQCAAVADHVPATHQRVVAQVAEGTTVPQLRRLLARYSFDGPGTTEDPAGEDPAAEARAAERAAERERQIAAAQAPARLRMHHGLDGRFHLSFDAPADQGALVQNALREAKDALFATGDTTATLGDALVEVASRSLGSVGSPQRASHYRVYVHLAADSPSGWVNGGGAIPPGLASLFACDGALDPVIERGGVPVSVGRRMRIVPARTRRLVEDRDRGCSYPGCPVRAAGGFLEIHHVTPWAEGGRTDLGTNIALCPSHHRTVHTGDLVVSGTPGLPPGTLGALAFRTRYGLPIGPPRPPAPRRTEPHPPGRSPDGPPGHDRTSPDGSGGVLDHPPNPWTRPWVPPSGEPLHAQWVDLPSDAALETDAARGLAAPWQPWPAPVLR